MTGIPCQPHGVQFYRDIVETRDVLLHSAVDPSVSALCKNAIVGIGPVRVSEIADLVTHKDATDGFRVSWEVLGYNSNIRPNRYC